MMPESYFRAHLDPVYRPQRWLGPIRLAFRHPNNGDVGHLIAGQLAVGGSVIGDPDPTQTHKS